MKYLSLLIIFVFFTGCTREVAVSAANIKVMADKQLEVLAPNKDKNSENARILAEAIKIEAGTVEKVIGKTAAPTLSATMSPVEMKKQVEIREKLITNNNWGWVGTTGLALLAILGFAVKTYMKSSTLGKVLTSVVAGVQEYKESVRESRPSLATQLSKTLAKHSTEQSVKVVKQIKEKHLKAGK
jgi:Na+-transporting methylmalonyl-CoA/oxaloacetate decarboxylase gamma subunit